MVMHGRIFRSIFQQCPAVIAVIAAANPRWYAISLFFMQSAYQCEQTGTVFNPVGTPFRCFSCNRRTKLVKILSYRAYHHLKRRLFWLKSTPNASETCNRRTFYHLSILRCLHVVRQITVSVKIGVLISSAALLCDLSAIHISPSFNPLSQAHRTVQQTHQFQHAAKTHLLSRLCPRHRSLPACVLTDQNPHVERS